MTQMLENTNSIQSRKARWRAFFDMGSSTRHIYFVNYHEDFPARPHLWREKKRERIDWSWETYSRHMDQTEWLRDDRLPFLSNVTGTELFAEAFGCKVHRPPESNPCALPLIHRSTEVSKLQIPSLDCEAISATFEIADELHERSGGQALMGLPDIQSPMDISALIWDKNSFYIALIEEPAAVKELSGKVFEFLTSFLDEWFSRYGTEYIAHYPSYYMNEGMTLSEDEIGAIDTSMFDEFFYEELCELSVRYGGIGIHCCANAVHQWDNIKRIPDLRLLNLNVESERATRYFENHVPQWHTMPDEVTPTDRIGRISGNAHGVIQIGAENREQAVRFADEMWLATGRN